MQALPRHGNITQHANENICIRYKAAQLLTDTRHISRLVACVVYIKDKGTTSEQNPIKARE